MARRRGIRIDAGSKGAFIYDEHGEVMRNVRKVVITIEAGQRTTCEITLDRVARVRFEGEAQEALPLGAVELPPGVAEEDLGDDPRVGGGGCR